MEATNVVFDISVLNELTASTSNRTGVFRVVDRLALQLASRPECQLSFTCGKAILDIDSLMGKVVDEYPELAGFKPARLWTPETVVTRFSSVRSGIRQLKAVRQRSFKQKLKLELARAWASLLKRRVAFDASRLVAGGVFHSPWDPLPPRHLFNGSQCVRAITIYDMTPVMFPQYFKGNEGTLKSFNSILGSIAPDDHVMAISQSTKRDFCGITGHDPTRVHVTPLAADKKMFAAVDDPQAISAVRRKYGIPDGSYVLSVNTLQPRKNIDHCVRSFVKFVQQQKVRDLSLVLVGDRGWGASQIDDAQRASGLSGSRIITTGYVPDSDLAALYSGAIAFIYVSHYEGFGLPPLEAMQCGLPVITSDNSSLPEVVGDGGIMVGATDGDALCAALQSLYENPSLRDAYAKRAAVRAGAFSWERCADLTVSAYRDMLNAGTR